MYKLLYSAVDSIRNGVRIIVGRDLKDTIANVRRIDDRILSIKIEKNKIINVRRNGNKILSIKFVF